MHWIRRSVGCRVASASPRLATRHSSPGVTAARFIASVNLRRLTSRRVSGYLPTYLPIHLAIRAAPRCASKQAAASQRAALSPFVFRFISSRASYARRTLDNSRDGQPLDTHYAATACPGFFTYALQIFLRI